jgi:hypothetical protein
MPITDRRVRIPPTSLIVAVLLLPTGCNRNLPLAQSDLPGLYVCNLPGPQQTIDVRNDGTFTQTIGKDDQRTYRGRWTAQSSETALHIMFRPYRFEWPTFIPGSQETGDWIPIARRTRDSVVLVLSDGDGLFCAREGHASGR